MYTAVQKFEVSICFKEISTFIQKRAALNESTGSNDLEFSGNNVYFK